MFVQKTEIITFSSANPKRFVSTQTMQILRDPVLRLEYQSIRILSPIVYSHVDNTIEYRISMKHPLS